MKERGGRLMNRDRVLEGKVIYISGSRHLENEALARFLVKETGARCEAVSFEQMEALSRQVPSPQTRLFLFDALDRGIQAMIADRRPGTNGYGDLLSGLFSVLFRDDTNGGGPDRKLPAMFAAFSIASTPRMGSCWPSGPVCRSGIRAPRTTRRIHATGECPRSVSHSPSEPEGVPHLVHDGRRPQQRGYRRTSQYQQPYRSDSPLQYIP